MLTPNKWYDAKLTEYGITQKEGKAARVFLQFTVLEETRATVISWFGTLSSEKSTQRVLKTLLTVGMTSDDINDVAKGKAGGVLDCSTLYRVKVEEQEYQGKKRQEIGLVSRAAPKKFEAALEKKQADDIAAQMRALRKQSGEPAAEKKKFEPDFS